ncbi:MAG: DUF2491 family protein [Erythrobacter sp.]
MIRKFFGKKDEPETPREWGPLAVAIGGALDVDMLGVEAAIVAGEPGMPVPSGGPFIVAAVGTAQFDADVFLTRYYDEDNRILQVLAPKGASAERIADISIYQPWDSVSPASEADWRTWTGPNGYVGARVYDADGLMFDRYWGDGDGQAELVEFVESVNDGDTTTRIHQRCMLYARPVGNGEEMLLLNIERDLDDDATQQGASIEFLLGYGLGAADVRRV